MISRKEKGESWIRPKKIYTLVVSGAHTDMDVCPCFHLP